MVGYRAKWDPASFEYQHTPRRFDFPPEDTPLLLRLRELCLQCWELFTLGGYARVDFRVDHQGNPWILEVNANPCLSPDAGFAAALGQAGISFDQAIAQILRCAVERKLREHSLATATVAVRSATRPSFSAPSTPPARLPPANETLRAALNPLEEAIFPPGGNWTFRHEVRAGDVAAVRRLAETAGIFRPAEIAVAVELVEQRLAHGPASGYEFIFAERPEPPKKQGQAEDEESVVGYVCYGPITMTVGGYDLYWIVVNRHHQGQGLGSALLNQCEQVILRQGGRRVYVETSGRAEYAATRAFYEHRGYRRAAVVGDFYSPGDDKIIYLKSLPTAEPCADSLRNSMEP
jgi:GNAT superfamily N-acetyltransferase